LGFVAELEPIWWGVSVEDRKYGLPRINALRQAPAALRFLSIEPLLEDLEEISLEGIHWVIVGGESGNGARQMKEEWVTSIRKQCEEAVVPFFFKQWGGVRKAEAGRMLDGQTYDDMPERQSRKVPADHVRMTMLGKVRKWEADYKLPETTAERAGITECQPLLF
jgi:protein gp37